ncbi:MAG: hypothetical protein ACOX4H_02210 [Bacillota bacterium]|jgi:hypothetical protein|nr:hypothetical protein [Clostridia bacterium]
MSQDITKKIWISPQIMELEIKKTSNGGGYGWFDIAFQDTGDDYELDGS